MPLQALVCSALLLLRNLSFSVEAKTHLLAHPRLMPVLLAHSERPAENARGAAIAASALWALTYQGEKVGQSRWGTSCRACLPLEGPALASATRPALLCVLSCGQTKQGPAPLCFLFSSLGCWLRVNF